MIDGKEQLPFATTVLLVEDEETVRQLVTMILEQEGYRVLQAASAEEARETWRDESVTVELLLTDINLGETNGIDLAREFRIEKPGLPIVFVTGFDEQILSDSGSLIADAQMLAKPYTNKKLTETIRQALLRTQFS